MLFDASVDWSELWQDLPEDLRETVWAHSSTDDLAIKKKVALIFFAEVHHVYRDLYTASVSTTTWSG